MRDPRFAALRAWEMVIGPDQTAAVEALARAVARGPVDVARLREAEERRLKEISPAGAWTAFAEAFARELESDSERRGAWSGEFRAAVARETADVSKLALVADEGKILAREAKSWKEELDPFKVWAPQWDRDHISYFTDIFRLLGYLLHIDPDAWIAAVEALPSPRWMNVAMFAPALQEDHDLILDLLRRAPGVVDAQGARSGVVALLLLDAALEHTRELHEAVGYPARTSLDTAQRAGTETALGALRRDEIPDKMRKAYGVLLERPDARSIIPRLLARLARDVLLGRGAGPGQGWSIHQCALDALAAVLARAGVSVVDLEATWEHWDRKERARTEEDQRNPRRVRGGGGDEAQKAERWGEGRRTIHAEGLPLLIGAADMLTEMPPSSDAADHLWRWFEWLLDGRDPGLALAEHGRSMSLVPSALGAMLARLPDWTARWRVTWRRLEPQRRRAQFARRYEDIDIDLGSRLLVLIGLYACAHALSGAVEPGQTQEVRGFFPTVYEAARRLWLTAVFDIGEARRNLVCKCFAFMPAIFGNALGDALGRTAPRIAGDPALLVLAAWYLWRNGVAPDQLERLLAAAGADLRGALRDVQRWAWLTQQEEQLSVEVQKLAEALGEDLAAPSERLVEPRAEQMKKSRAALAQRIPWARGLLQRLEEDGCSLSTLHSLDRRGTSWILQARLSQALATGFGLAPEARILVASGWVDGQDLEVVMQAPGGADEVDPDLVIVANDRPDLADRLGFLPGPWGQRVPWPPLPSGFAPLADQLRAHLRDFDIFDRRDPVRIRQLVGRKELVRKLAARLTRGEALGVFGLRKVGKSSLLRAVVEAIDPVGVRRGFFESEAAPLSDAEPHALVIALDVQSVVERTRDAIVERIAEELRARLTLAGLKRATGDERSADALAELERLLRWTLRESQLPICVVLDEYDLLFEGYTGEPGIQAIEGLFQLLRALAQETRRVSVAAIGRDPVFFQRPLMGGFTNPMLGWAETFWLGPLAREEADELLTRLGLRVGLDVGPATLDAAWRLTGGHPLLLRQYGSALLDAARGQDASAHPQATDPLREDAREAFSQRDIVRNLVFEVQALLASRFPEALSLLEALAGAGEGKASSVIARHGGWGGGAALVLRQFGIATGSADAPWTPEVFRWLPRRND